MINRHRAIHQEEGFTLMEVLVTIAMIAIVTALAVPSFVFFRKVNVDNQVKTDITGVVSTVEAWSIKHPSSTVPSGTIEYGSNGTIVSVNIKNSGMSNFTVNTEGTKITLAPSTRRGTFKIIATNPRGNKSVSGLVYDNAQKDAIQ